MVYLITEELADHPAFDFDSIGLLPMLIFGLDEDLVRSQGFFFKESNS